ncbi:MAG: hypothetical protein ACSLE3_15475, partial [Microbacteriaceae bacterium]
SELKYLIDCPYQFKLRFMYGFNPPIHEALGYRELTGESADIIQILNLDAKSDDYTARVDDALLTGIKSKVQTVAADIRAGQFDCGHDHSKEGAYNDLVWLTTGSPHSGLPR